MWFIKFLITTVMVVGIGYAVYHYGTKFVSVMVMESISTELEKSGEMEGIKQAIESDPELMSFLEDAKAIDNSNLAFTTKEEATKVLIKKVGITDLNEIREKLQDGAMSKEEALAEFQSNLTEEEIVALKVLAYKEIYGQ